MSFQFSNSRHLNAPILALHSSASNSRQWKQLESDLGNRFVVHAVDLPGYGNEPTTGDVVETGMAVAAIPIIDQIEKMGGPVHLVGHSNGGGVAIKVALMRPDLIKSLTVYEPAAFHFLKNGDAASRKLFDGIRNISTALQDAVDHGDAAMGMKTFLDFWNAEGFWDKLSNPAQQKFVGMMASVMSDFANGFAETWMLHDLSILEMPALVMTGLESPEIAQRVSADIARALPNSRIALLPELGHMAPVYQPEWVNSRILEHVACVERPLTNCSWPDRHAA